MVKEEDKEWAWEQAKPIRGKSQNLWRRDEEGNPIYKPAFGKGGDTGWQVDHRRPVARGGTDHRRNLRALQTKANQEKADKYP